MIDAARDFETGSGSTYGGTGSGNYTTVAFVEGVGKGATFTPAGGDTSKKLFVPNSGYRSSSGYRDYHGVRGYFLSVTQATASNAWYLYFNNGDTSGGIGQNSKFNAYSLRCVRS